MPQNVSFKIVHLSDLHLTKNDKDLRSEPKLLGRLKGMNNAFRNLMNSPAVRAADLVLVSGDITDRGDIEVWKMFWNTVQNAQLANKILVLPGNHDVCCLGARFPKPRTNYREEDLEKARKGLRMGNQPIQFPWVWPDTKKTKVAIFGLNSNNLGNLTGLSNALGEVSFYQLLSLASKLHMYRDVPVKIIVLHHSPNMPGPETAKKKKQPIYSDAERSASQIPEWERRGLRLLAVTHRVRLIIHGHLHEAEDRRVNGIRIIGAPATTEPYPLNADNSVYRFWTYTVSGKNYIVKCELTSLPVNG